MRTDSGATVAAKKPKGLQNPAHDDLDAHIGMRLATLRIAHTAIRNEVGLYLADPGNDHRTDRQMLEWVLWNLETAEK